MTRDEAIWVIAFIMEAWPSAQQWTDRQCEMWIADLEDLDFGRASDAIKACRNEHHFTPSWAQFKEAYRTVTWQQLAPERQSPTRAIEAGYLPRAESVRRVRELKGILSKASPAMSEHNHKRGVSACPICGAHDRDEHGRHNPDHCSRCKTIAKDTYRELGGPRD